MEADHWMDFWTLGFVVVLLFNIIFLIIFATGPTKRVRALFLPLVILATYVPYEMNLLRPGVIQYTPIRIDLFVLWPLLQITMICGLVGWLMVLKKTMAAEPDAELGSRRRAITMSLVMLACCLGWWALPFVVVPYLMGW